LGKPINTGMHPCRSVHRCNQTTCQTLRLEACRVRQSPSSRRVGRPLLCSEVGRPRTDTAAIASGGDPQPHRLSASPIPWWRAFGWVLYQTKDGDLRGVATLGTLAALEVVEAFHARWPTTLRLIRAEDLRLEVWRCMRPAVMPPTLTGRGGYQALRLTIGPCRSVVRTPVLSSYPPEFVAPMPVLL
jgi:hypothetical protein